MAGKLNYRPEDLAVMVIDDHDPIRKAIKRILIKHKIGKVVECFDGSEALNELKRTHVDLILADLYMRKVSGFTILEYVRNRQVGTDIPFIVVTGEASKEDIVKASDMGANDYILKPFQAEALEAKVQQVLNNFFSPPPVLKALREGDRLLMEEKPQEALGAYVNASRIEPGSMRAKHSIAVAQLALGNQAKALEMLLRNTRESSTYYKNYASLANIFLERKENGKAIKALKKELELNPKQPERQVMTGRLLHGQGDSLGAIKHFREALKDNGKHPDALLGIGKAFVKTENLDKALYYFRRLRRHHPKATIALELMIKACVKFDATPRAEIILRDEKKAHPTRFDTYVELARFYMAQDKLGPATETLAELFKLDENNAAGLAVKAAIEMKQKNYPKALQTLKALVSKDPSLENMLSLVKCMHLVKKIQESIAVLHRALRVKPQNPQTLFLLGQAFKHSKQYYKAYLMFNAARRSKKMAKVIEKKMQFCLARLKSRQQREGF